jgi:hypothetical protein
MYPAMLLPDESGDMRMDSTKKTRSGPRKSETGQSAERAQSGALGGDVNDDSTRADLSIFNRYVAQVTGEFKNPRVGRPARKSRDDIIKEKLGRLDAQRDRMTAAQYMRRRARIAAAAPTRQAQTEDLRGRFLDALPRIMGVEGWTAQDLQAVGVPYRDLVEVGARKPRGPRVKK